MRKVLAILCLACTTVIVAQNRPYIDDKMFHFGFSLGINMMHYSVTPSLMEFDGEIYQARVSSLLPGFSVGLIGDMRLSRHLNLRFCPTLHFGNRTLTYKTESGSVSKLRTDVLSLPITIPLYLKWSAEREINYRPYLIAGGGMAYDFGIDKERKILQKPIDVFLEVGAGCDFYFEWFKLCPQITYQIGFLNILTPVEKRPELQQRDFFYTQSISRLLQRQINITFNFE